MILYVDSENKIRAVDRTTDETLTPLYVNEEYDLFPFKGWSTAKICCYKVTVQDGFVTMMTPYRDSRTLDFIDEVGKDNDEKTEALNILFGNEEV